MQSLLLIISGSVAAYKSLELIRLLRARGVAVTTILTRGGEEFVTPLSVSALSGQPTYAGPFSLNDEVSIGHIALARGADAVLVAPASADILAKMAAGLADDLATTALLATGAPVFVAPAMNPHMWEHPATQRNIARLVADGVRLIAPENGELACGETGTGRFASPERIIEALLGEGLPLPPEGRGREGGVIRHSLASQPTSGGRNTLTGKHILITAGPTHEAIDPVRYIANRSSGKQGYAIAGALAARGARVTLVSGPTTLAAPAGVTRVDVTSASEMARAAEAALPADAAICTAAVADWHVAHVASQKIKKTGPHSTPHLTLVENPDILALLSQHKTQRPKLVVGFAAETENVVNTAAEKRRKKSCDWMLANDVSGGAIFGADATTLHFITAEGAEHWPAQSKLQAAEALAERISIFFS